MKNRRSAVLPDLPFFTLRRDTPLGEKEGVDRPLGGGVSVKATGIVRRIDDLGRIVIPQEIRRSLRIRKGAPLELYVDRDGGVILKKYSAVAELKSFAQRYLNSIHQTTGRAVAVLDYDEVVAVAGLPEDEWVGKPVTPVLERYMDDRRVALFNGADFPPPSSPGEEEELLRRLPSGAVAPIVSRGDTNGAIIVSALEGEEASEIELKLAETAAGFLARHMDH